MQLGLVYLRGSQTRWWGGLSPTRRSPQPRQSWRVRDNAPYRGVLRVSQTASSRQSFSAMATALSNAEALLMLS
jgi:hypothetical protein